MLFQHFLFDINFEMLRAFEPVVVRVTFRGLGPLLRDLGADTMHDCSVDVELEMPLALAYLPRPSYSIFCLSLWITMNLASREFVQNLQIVFPSHVPK
jgi:hypothetical protein